MACAPSSQEPVEVVVLSPSFLMVFVNLLLLLLVHAHRLLDYESEKLQAVIDSLAGSSFDPYLTSVGGSGLGILSPHQKKDERAPESYRQMFASMNIGTLTPWAESQGRWLYV